jgi:hypothetical protein
MINNEQYIIKTIPKFHAISQRYDRLSFWKEQKKLCIEGCWIGGKWMPGTLYYYINFHTIRFEDESGASRKIGRPWLRDIDWDKAYMYEEAMGFSGFSEDSLYTCNRFYGPEKDRAIKYGWLTENEISQKIYIPAKEYLRRLHPAHLGKPLYKNQAKNVMDLEARGGGKSYWASALILHNFLFDGAYDYDVYLENRKMSEPLTSDTVVGAIESKYSDDLVKKVKIAIDHLPDKQIINGELYPSPLYVGYSGSFAPGKTITSSTGSVINHRTFMDDPLAANGTRPNRAFLEEVAFMNNIVEVVAALESTQASADNKNLVIYMLGTGGLSSHGAVIYTKEIFNNPEEFNCLAFDDVWENKGKIGYFLPATHTINKFKYGPNKITLEDKAKEYVEESIEIARKSGNRRKYMAEIINKPLKPSDIFLTLEGNFFPIDDLRERLGEIENNKRTLEASWKVEFYIVSGKVEWKLSGKPVLREFPHRRGDILDTAIEIYELPKMDSNDTIPYGRYLASLDPVDNDGGDDTEHSLLCGFILDSWTDRIVVEYTGRTRMTEDFYEQWRRCLIYFNAMCNYERNLKGFYPHMKNSNSLHYLCDQPQILMEKGLAKGEGAIGNQTKGTHCTTPIANWGLELILSYLGARAYEQPYVDPDKPDEAVYIKNLHNLKSPALIQELIAYNSEINADRVSSLVLLMILREDRLNLSKSAFSKKVDTVTKNKFWDKAYKSFGQKNKFLDSRINHMKN